MNKQPHQSTATEAELRRDIDARARLMECMQDLIKGLGQANTDLARELGMRRRISGELVSHGVAQEPEDVSGATEESLVITCGESALLSVPESKEWVVLPHQTREEGSAAGSKKNGAAHAGILVTRWKPIPRLLPLGEMLANLPPARQSALLELVGEVVCRELARPILTDRRFTATRDDPELGVVVTDASGVIRMINPTLCRISGWSMARLVGRPLDPTLLARREDRRSSISPSRDLQFTELWLRNSDATLLPVKVFSREIRAGSDPTGSVSVVMPVTQRKAEIDELAARERFYRRFFEEDVTGDYSCTPDGKLIACNPAFARIFGFSSVDEAMKCNLRQLHVNGESADFFLDTLRRHRRLNYYESMMRRVDGTQLHVIRNVIGTFDGDGNLTEITGHIFDNSEQRELEDKVRKSQKMESVGRLAGGIAHDFNNLILAIQGYAELLEEHVREIPDAGEALQQIQKASDRATVLTRQLLAFSRRQVLQPTRLDLNDVVSGMSSLLQRMLGEDVELVANLDEELHPVRADRAQLEQVLVNLASNARDAMPDGGRLTLSTSNVNLQDTWFPFHDGPPPGQYVELIVHDNGVGMSDEVKAHLFEPFFSTKDRGKGVGLGLSTVYGIIKQSGGEIQAYSQQGDGTTFKVYLPRFDESQGVEAKTADRSNVRVAGRTILLVEDEESVRMLVHKILTKHGFTIIDAMDGKDALAKMEDYDGEAPLLLTDLIMPQMSGRELSERLQSRFADLEVIYMSGYTEDEVIKRGVMQDRVNFLQKPFNPTQLIEKVRDVLSST